jgi:predicted nucleic acid-binding protein
VGGAEADSAKAIVVRDEIRSRLHEAIAPDVYPIELGHALTRAERRSRISAADGYALWVQPMRDCPRLFPALPLMPQAYALSSRFRIGIYDALYLSLAEQEQCALLTADDKLIKNYHGSITVTSLASL